MTTPILTIATASIALKQMIEKLTEESALGKINDIQADFVDNKDVNELLQGLIDFVGEIQDRIAIEQGFNAENKAEFANQLKQLENSGDAAYLQLSQAVHVLIKEIFNVEEFISVLDESSTEDDDDEEEPAKDPLAESTIFGTTTVPATEPDEESITPVMHEDDDAADSNNH